MAKRLLLLALVALSACGGGGATTELVGAELAGEIGCLGCHSGADTATAPTLDGIWGTEVALTDGSTVTVDESYVRRSIVDPGADIVEGYEAVMPDFSLGESEIDRLVEWVEGLG